LPPTLHWFYWEAYTTWLSGFALLCLLYFLRAEAYLIDPASRHCPSRRRSSSLWRF
jgi:uncharacterized membrane protein